jgi:twitching motility protein PilT
LVLRAWTAVRVRIGPWAEALNASSLTPARADVLRAHALKAKGPLDDEESMSFDLDAALADTIRINASDLHVKVPSRPRVRVAGKLIDLPSYGEVSPEDTLDIKSKVMVSSLKREQFERDGSTDFSYFTPDGRFRVSAFTQRGSMSFVFRAVPKAPDADELGLPEAIASWSDARRGLVVVTGPTGSGKSTTSAAIIDRINRRRPCHILTIEDPIEFLHPDQQAIVCQREIGLDAPAHHTALRAALRQDPDVIMIGEVRDEETGMTALRAAETGHLVLCTMHTIDAAESIQRFVNLFGEDRGGLARQMLAATLVGICSQRLVPAVNGGMVLSSEVLVNSTRVRDLIAEAADHSELHTAIGEGEYYGMHTFDQSLIELIREGKITEADAMDYASNGHDFKLMLDQAGLGALSVSPNGAPQAT